MHKDWRTAKQKTNALGQPVPMSTYEIAKLFEVSISRIRQIQEVALSKLCHESRSKHLVGYRDKTPMVYDPRGRIKRHPTLDEYDNDKGVF